METSIMQWWPINWFLISSCKWMERVIQCFGLSNRKLNFFSLPTTSTVLFQKLAFLKKKLFRFFINLFGVQRKAEQQSSPVAFNNTMATIQLQTSPGIGWSLHTLAPGASLKYMYVCVCMCEWERERVKEAVIGGCTIGGVTWRESKAVTCNRVRRKIIKMVSGQKPLHKIRKLLVWERRKKHFLLVLNSKFKVHSRKFLA